jgi:DNA-directed RNA polymerase specialized sigma24 family protein
VGGTVAQHILSDNQSQPAGSAYVDDILQRYLPSIGSRQFRLHRDENRPYALAALARIVNTYSTDQLAIERLWQSVARGSPYDHILLLPNTESALSYHAKRKNHSMVLNLERSVKLALRTTFCNLILGDIRREKRLRETETEFFWLNHESGTRRHKQPTHREKKSAADDDKLEVILEAFAEIKYQGELEYANYIMKLTFETMNNAKHEAVVRALLAGDSPLEAASRFNMSVGNVHKINKKFMQVAFQIRDETSKLK